MSQNLYMEKLGKKAKLASMNLSNFFIANAREGSKYITI